MKALKSKLASQLLADPAASAQLREFLVNRSAFSDASASATGQIVIPQKNGFVRVQATVVPKAPKAI